MRGVASASFVALHPATLLPFQELQEEKGMALAMLKDENSNGSLGPPVVTASKTGNGSRPNSSL